MLVSMLSLALALVQYVHAQVVRTRSVHPSHRASYGPACIVISSQRSMAAHSADPLCSVVYSVVRCFSSCRLDLPVGRVLPSMETYRALQCNRRYPRDDGALTLCTWTPACLFPHAIHPGIGWATTRPIGFTSPAGLNGTSVVYRKVYFLPM